METKICLNTADRRKVEQLAEVMDMNNKTIRLLCLYLTQCPNFITSELMDNICSECGITEESAFGNLLIAACGLDTENNPTDRQLANDYLVPSIRKLDLLQYRSNPYYQHIRIPEIHKGNWQLIYEKYKPYEAFVCGGITVNNDFKETPHIGFFDTEFTFPAVMQNNREWMAIKPNEIETMQEAIQRAKGRIITFGLGMGYYAYMTSQKTEVESITIIEKDSAVISLFTTHILPQFPQRQKITVIQADAFDYATQQMPAQRYDFAFVDLWHDVSDGYPLYLKMKALEQKNPETTFHYWIEDSLLSHMRWLLFHRMYDALTTTTPEASVILPSVPSIDSFHQFSACLKDTFLRKLAKTEPFAILP